MVFDESTISIIISLGALFIALLAYFESIHARRKAAKERELQRKLDMCEQAIKLLLIDTHDMPMEAIKFNKLMAIRTILDQKLIYLNEKEYNELAGKVREINDDYEKISGQRLGFNFTEYATTAQIYSIDDFPAKLEVVYAEVKEKALAYQAYLYKRIGK